MTNPTIPVRASVQALSGRNLGEVKARRKGAFLLSPHDEAMPERWLTEDCVFSVEPGIVTLICEAEGLPRYGFLERAVG